MPSHRFLSIIWSSIAQQEFDHVNTAAIISSVCVRISWCCNLFTTLYRKREEKNIAKVRNVKLSLLKTMAKIVSLFQKISEKGLSYWIGLHRIALHYTLMCTPCSVRWLLHLLYLYCIDFFCCDFGAAELKCQTLKSVAHIVWWVSYDYLIWSVVHCVTDFFFRIQY